MHEGLSKISPGKLVLVRWRDIVWSKKGIDDEDIEHISPQFELIGKFKCVRRGIAAIQVEWGLLKDYEDEYDGDAGHEMQIMPVGCIELIREIKLGKTLYKKAEMEKEPEVNAGQEGTKQSE